MKIHVLVALLVVIFGFSGQAYAQGAQAAEINGEQVKSEAIQPQSEDDLLLGKWVRDANSVVNSQGLNIPNAGACEKFEIEISGKHFQFKFKCGGHFSSGLLPLVQGDDLYRIERSVDSIMITKLGYYGLRLQTGKARRELVKIPFVEEVFRFKVIEGKSLSFYHEQFKVDDYGRIVQNNYMQAFGLSKKMLKISGLQGN